MTGGCYCGAIRYEISHQPLAMFNCHCRACQKISGGAYTPVVVVATKAFKLTQGQLTYHFTDRINDGGRHKRGFCADCGSRVTGAEFDEKQPFLAVTGSSLDDPTLFKPQSDVFVSHAQAWDRMDPNLPKHDLYPPR